MPEFLAGRGRGSSAAGIFVRILRQRAHGDPLPQNIAQREAYPQPALDPIDLGEAFVPEDEPPWAVEHAKTLGHVAKRGVRRSSCAPPAALTSQQRPAPRPRPIAAPAAIKPML